MRISIISTGAPSRRVAANQPIVVPMGVGNLVHDLGFHIVHELDYWQTVELGPLENFAHSVSPLGRPVPCGFAP